MAPRLTTARERSEAPEPDPAVASSRGGTRARRTSPRGAPNPASFTRITEAAAVSAVEAFFRADA